MTGEKSTDEHSPEKRREGGSDGTIISGRREVLRSGGGASFFPSFSPRKKEVGISFVPVSVGDCRETSACFHSFSESHRNKSLCVENTLINKSPYLHES